ncbi:MAG: hypothetical protein JSW54_11125 [Fidelibacterota bacterium]|nr:MAG: hypothetical protein JSW54_11125 [Candidatus Neomarinimicrobiota bacterium]
MEDKPTSFLRVWLMGYTQPLRVGEALRDKPAPFWGLAAQLIRAMMDALLVYLPMSIIGAVPESPSTLSFIPTESYYAISVGMAPLFILGQWLLLCAVLHVVLRLTGRASDLDQILNLTGMAALVVGTVLVVWDWIWFGLGWHSDVVLGISHLVIDVWGIVIIVAGLRILLGVPVKLGIILNLIWLALGVPLAMIFMRSPV